MHDIEREEYQWQSDECTYLEDAVGEMFQKIDSQLEIPI
jgi:hypothetical protein